MSLLLIHWENFCYRSTSKFTLRKSSQLSGFPTIDVLVCKTVPYRLKIIQNVLQHLALPTLVLTILPTMEIVRLVQQRAEIIFQQNYVKVATTRGWSKFKGLTQICSAQYLTIINSANDSPLHFSHYAMYVS